MPLYAAALYAVKLIGSDIKVLHAVAVIKASSEEEAIGIGLVKAKEIRPAAEGWTAHDAVVNEVTEEKK